MVQKDLLLIVASASAGAVATLVIRELRAELERRRRISHIKSSLLAEIDEGRSILKEIENPNEAPGEILPPLHMMPFATK